MVTLNLADTNDFEPVAKQEQFVRAVIYDSELTDSRNGEEMLKVTWKVKSPESVEDRDIKDNWMLEGQGAGFTADKLEVIKPEILSDLADQEADFNPEDLYGSEARLELSIYEGEEDEQGEIREFDQVEQVYPVDEDEVEEEDGGIDSFIPS